MKILTKYLPEIPNQVMAPIKGTQRMRWFAPGETVDTEEEAKEIERLAGRDIIYNRVSERSIEFTKVIEAEIVKSPETKVDDLIDKMIAAVKGGEDGNAD